LFCDEYKATIISTTGKTQICPRTFSKKFLSDNSDIKLKNFGNERVGGGIGALGVISTFSLSLFASNTSFEVSFATTDSNGGSCNWSLSE
jgi:hypothetical protein